MAVVWSTGTQNHPSYTSQLIYVQDNVRESFSVGNSTVELNRYTLNNVPIRHQDDVVYLGMRLFNSYNTPDDEFAYGWQYKDSSGNWQRLNQNKCEGQDHFSRAGAAHVTHDTEAQRYGGHTRDWGVLWRPGASGFAGGSWDLRPVIHGHGTTSITFYINHFHDGYSGNDSDWNRRSSSYVFAQVFSKDGCVNDTN